MELFEAIIFNNELFGAIRFIDVEGKPYAVANDIATALGYARPRKAVLDHCKRVDKRVMELTPQNGAPANGVRKTQEISIIPESDIYRLIMKSKLPKAEAFENWIMEEVIPQIRKTGGYIPVENQSELEIMAKAFAIAQRTINNFDEIIEKKDAKICEQEKIIEKQKDDLVYLDKVIAPPKLISSTDVAKDLGMTAVKLHKVLHLRGYIYKTDRDKCWKFYHNHQHMVPEYADYHVNEYAQTLKWTELGRRFIVELIENDTKTQQIIADIDKQRKESKNKRKCRVK